MPHPHGRVDARHRHARVDEHGSRWRGRADGVLAASRGNDAMRAYGEWMDEDISLLIEDVSANFAP